MYSSTVTTGMTILASQYNNLRTDVIGNQGPREVVYPLIDLVGSTRVTISTVITEFTNPTPRDFWVSNDETYAGCTIFAKGVFSQDINHDGTAVQLALYDTTHATTLSAFQYIDWSGTVERYGTAPWTFGTFAVPSFGGTPTRIAAVSMRDVYVNSPGLVYVQQLTLIIRK